MQETVTVIVVFHLVQFLSKSLIISHYRNTTIIVLFTYELQSGLKAVHFTKMCTTTLKNNLFKIKTCTVVTVDVTVTGLFQIYSRLRSTIFCKVSHVSIAPGPTLCSEKKHPLTFSFISPCVMSRFKQKLQWIYLRNGEFWQRRN